MTDNPMTWIFSGVGIAIISFPMTQDERWKKGVTTFAVAPIRVDSR